MIRNWAAQSTFMVVVDVGTRDMQWNHDQMEYDDPTLSSTFNRKRDDGDEMGSTGGRL